MKEELNIYIGYDSRQDVTPNYSKVTNSPFMVCYESIRHFNQEVFITALKLDELIEQGIYTREVDPLASTEFTYSRFLTPYLNGFEGIALFCDSDFLWQCNITDILEYYDQTKAVMCVQHDYVPKLEQKMDGYKQTVYPRKNWSSLMLFNCAHPDCKNLTPENVNTKSPKYLHRMEWTTDDNIGNLPLWYNWLEGEYNGDTEPYAIHYTNGGPWYKTYNGDYKQNWIDIYNKL